MKHKLLLLLALIIGLASNVWADGFSGSGTGTSEDPYQITNATQLVEFADIVNGGVYNACAVLINDIDMKDVDISKFPIGNPSDSDLTQRFLGVFDGQGHKIYNFNLVNTSAAQGFGMFNTGKGVVLKNFWLDSTCKIQGTTSVGLIGRHNGGSGTFEGIGNCAEVKGTNNNIGGLFGGVWAKSTEVETVTIKNCWTTGKVEATVQDSNKKYKDCGAISGWFNNAKVEFVNCWTIADVKYTNSDAKYVFRNGNGATFTYSHCFSKNGSQPNFTTITDAQLENGEACYLLNGSTSGGTDWYQTLGTDGNPYPYDTHGVVYRNGVFCPDTGAPHGTFSYGNADEASTGEHDYNVDDGLCTYCSYPKADFITPEDTYYEIGTPGQLKWFAAYVNVGNPAVNAKLTASPIDLDGVEWTPIGNASTPYAGEFDGQGNAITNFSYTSTGNGGLFGKIASATSATIKDFSIEGLLEVNEGTGSGVIGWSSGYTISGIHSSLTITTKEGVAVSHVGGVVGSLNQNDNVSGCSFNGSITVNANSHNCFGGIVGYATSKDLVSNCLFTEDAEVSYQNAGAYAGGIQGYLNDAKSYGVQNCLSLGTVEYTGEGDPTYGGAIFGRLRNNPGISKIFNNYWLENSAPNATGDNSIEGACQSVSLAQLASGEVAYNLGAAWYQTIGTDDYPTLDSSNPQVYEIAVSDAGYTSFVPTVNVATIPDGVTVYAGQDNGTYLHLEEVEEVPADNAFVVKATAGNYYYNNTDESRSIGSVANDLTYSPTALTSDGTQYCLANKASGVGFYQVNEGVTIPARKVYLASGSNVKAFFFDEDDATGINSPLLTSPEEEGQVYNLAGQRVNKLQKGINIINGKKVLK